MSTGTQLQKQQKPGRRSTAPGTGPGRNVRGALARRKLVAEYRLKGIQHQGQIARELGVHRSLICRDFKVLDEEFAREAAQDIALHKALDLRRIEDIIGQLWDKRNNAQVARTILLYLERKAALLGMDAPTKVDISDWRAEARKMGMDPETLFRETVAFVGQRSGAFPPPPVLDMIPNPGDPHNFALDPSGILSPDQFPDPEDDGGLE